MIGWPRPGTWDLDKGQGHAGKLRTEPLPLKFLAQGVNLTQPANWASQLALTSGETANQRVKRGPDELGISAAGYKTADL